MTVFVFCHGSGENVVIEPLNSIERLFHIEGKHRCH